MSRPTWSQLSGGLSLRPSTAREIQLWDGRVVTGWLWDDMPVFRFGWAPAGLATRRQLRALRMCPGGQAPHAALAWKGGQAWAWLWRLDLARASRKASPLQLNALNKAMAARRTCRQCARVQDYCVSVNEGRCADCIAGVVPDAVAFPAAIATAAADLGDLREAVAA
ncbi:MAG TPA: RRQRL motif-containing zinc-binding protein [Kribbellaceae bacterium]|jgi:hypothetical protein